jgi:hypothetical protein
MNFLAGYQAGYDSSSEPSQKFTGFNFEILRIIFEKIRISKNKSFRDKIYKGRVTRKSV